MLTSKEVTLKLSEMIHIFEAPILLPCCPPCLHLPLLVHIWQAILTSWSLVILKKFPEYSEVYLRLKATGYLREQWTWKT